MCGASSQSATRLTFNKAASYHESQTSTSAGGSCPCSCPCSWHCHCWVLSRQGLPNDVPFPLSKLLVKMGIRVCLRLFLRPSCLTGVSLRRPLESHFRIFPRAKKVTFRSEKLRSNVTFGILFSAANSLDFVPRSRL